MSAIQLPLGEPQDKDRFGDVPDHAISGALTALESFASALEHMDMQRLHVRPVITHAWGMARFDPEFYEGGISDRGSMSAEEAILAGIGSVVVRAGLEAKLELQQPSKSPTKETVWQILQNRVEDYTQAGHHEGVSPARIEEIRKLAAKLLAPYRSKLDGKPTSTEVSTLPSNSFLIAGPTIKDNDQQTVIPQSPNKENDQQTVIPESLNTGCGTKSPPDPHLWCCNGEKSEWHGPLPAREILRLVEQGELGPNALVRGLIKTEDTSRAANQTAEHKLIFECLEQLGKEARTEAEAKAWQKVLALHSSTSKDSKNAIQSFC